jgi:hypothetical protein
MRARSPIQGSFDRGWGRVDVPSLIRALSRRKSTVRFDIRNFLAISVDVLPRAAHALLKFSTASADSKGPPTSLLARWH